MRFYLAARFSRAEEMCEYRDVLHELGHKVTSRWIDGAERDGEFREKNFQQVSEIVAVEDLEDLANADVVLNFAGNGKSTKKKPPKGGRHVEFGVGLALNKMTVLIGEPEHAFHWLPSVERYATFEDYLDVLENNN
jgi:hypothetical protein